MGKRRSRRWTCRAALTQPDHGNVTGLPRLLHTNPPHLAKTYRVVKQTEETVLVLYLMVKPTGEHIHVPASWHNTP